MTVCEFTVAICTYRRADLLPTTLESLSATNRPDADWDVIVVDNDCDRHIEQIVKTFQDRLPIRYVAEPEIGTAHARNRAVNETQAPIILFTDDDVQFDPGWLCAMIDTVRQHPDCAFWGGRTKPEWTTPRPRWFDMDRCPMLADSIVQYDQGDQPRYWRAEGDPAFYTCNLTFRVDAIRESGMFDVALGHRGNKRRGGEDSWMIRSISRRGGKGWYAADALLYHPVPPERLTHKYARSFAWVQGRNGVYMICREHADKARPAGRTPRWLYGVAIKQLFGGLGNWAVGTVRRDSGRAFAGQFTALFNFSKLWHATVHRPAKEGDD